MKKFITAIVVISLFAATSTFAQKKTEEIKVKTSAQCEMCKERIEKAMAFEKGIVSSNLNLEDKVLTVTYKEGKTTPEKIRTAINDVGYDADDALANPKAYSELPACCKKPDDPDHVGH